MSKKPFNPNLNTPAELYCKEEVNKLHQSGLSQSSLYDDFRDTGTADLVWESDMIAKSAGIHLEFDRSLKRAHKDWYFMIRMVNPGGGPLNRQQWQIIDNLSERYCQDPHGLPSLRITTRQTFQFHWIRKQHVVPLVRTLAESGFYTLNACGDNIPNVTACPLSRFSKVFNAVDWARRINSYFQLPADPFVRIFAIDPRHTPARNEAFAYGPNLLNRKFKIGIGCLLDTPQGLVPDNCVEVRTHDVGIVPVIEKNKVQTCQIYIGGGQAERNGKPGAAVFGQPLTAVPESQLLTTLDAVVQVHQKWGDRENRHWSRLKYVVLKKGIPWYREQVSSLLGAVLPPPVDDLDCGDRHLHHGWQQHGDSEHLSFGAFIENGRLCDDSPNGKLKSMVRQTMDHFNPELSTTPNQDIIFSQIPSQRRDEFEDYLSALGYGQRNGKTYSRLRQKSGACVGLNTCRIAYTDAERFEPELIDELERRGWGDTAESIGITGCEAQCFRPATKTIGLVGFGWNRYQMKLFGSESARHQGRPLVSADGRHMYLQSIQRERVADVIDCLLHWHQQNKLPEEDLGAFLRRMASDAIIAHLKTAPATSSLMQQTYTTECLID